MCCIVLLCQPIRAAQAQSIIVAPTVDASHGCSMPVYPPEARRLEQQGTVILRFLVDSSGSVRQSEVQSSSGFPLLDQAALQALSQCAFKPATIDGKIKPDPTWAQLRYVWRLQDGGGATPGQPVIPTVHNGAALVPPATSFQIHCGTVPSLNDFADALNAVTKLQPLGATARVALPALEEAVPARCIDYYRRAQVEALRKSGLFSSVDLSEDVLAGRRPPSQGEDYSLWLDGGGLIVSFHGGPRSPINDGADGLAAWTRRAAAAANNARTLQSAVNNNLSTSRIGGEIALVYLGREYLSTADLALGITSGGMAELAALPHKAMMLRRLHIVLAPQDAVIGATQKNLAKLEEAFAKSMPNFNRNTSLLPVNQLAAAVAGYNQAKIWAQAAEKSGLFAEVTLEESAVSDPDLGRFDAVLWNEAGSAFVFHLKTARGKTQIVKATLTLAGWLEELRNAVERANQDG